MIIAQKITQLRIKIIIAITRLTDFKNLVLFRHFKYLFVKIETSTDILVNFTVTKTRIVGGKSLIKQVFTAETRSLINDNV